MLTKIEKDFLDKGITVTPGECYTKDDDTLKHNDVSESILRKALASKNDVVDTDTLDCVFEENGRYIADWSTPTSEKPVTYIVLDTKEEPNEKRNTHNA